MTSGARIHKITDGFFAIAGSCRKLEMVAEERLRGRTAMSGRGWSAAAGGAALAVAVALMAAPTPAAADGGVSVWVGGGCCYPHHHFYPGWGEPDYVMPPPPVVYGYGPPVVYGPPVTYAPPACAAGSGRARRCRPRRFSSTAPAEPAGNIRRPSPSAAPVSRPTAPPAACQTAPGAS